MTLRISTLQILENLHKKAIIDMNGEDQEWNNIFMTIYGYIATKYQKLPDINHNPDRNNTPDYKLADFEFKTEGIKEFPIGHYEMTNLCRRNEQGELVDFLTKEELIKTINEEYLKKNKKNYQIPSGISGLIFTTALTNSKLNQRDIFNAFREKDGNFDIIILLCSKNKLFNESFILIYNRISNMVHEIHLSIKDKVTINKDISINLLTGTLIHGKIFD